MKVEKLKSSKPKRFEVNVTDGDLSYGHYEVYLANEMDQWLDELKKVLRDLAYDPKIVQHGNVAKRILRQFFE